MRGSSDLCVVRWKSSDLCVVRGVITFVSLGRITEGQ